MVEVLDRVPDARIAQPSPLVHPAVDEPRKSYHGSPAKPAFLTKADKYVYKVEAAHTLPVLNLRLTLSWYALNAEKNLKFLKWTKRNFRAISFAYRLGCLVGFLALVLPRRFAWFLTVPAVILSIPELCCSYAMLSVDMVAILVRHYEFWFFTTMNLVTWITLSWLYRDVGVAFLIVVLLGIQLSILMDANFRTFVPAVKTCAVAVPLLLTYGIVVFLRLLDIPKNNYVSIRIAKVEIELVDIYLNTLFTLVLFLLRKAYNKRKLLYSRNANCRMVRCVIVRCSLVIRPMACHVGERKSVYRTRVILKQLGITAQKLGPAMRTGKALNHRQQVTLVSLRLSTIDVRRTMLSHLSAVQTLISPRYIGLLYSLGAVGLLCSGGSMLLPGSGEDVSFAVPVARIWVDVIPVVGFVCTSCFCAVFTCSYQRDYVRAMFRNFGFLFPSLQFALACVCLADAMQWDNRCWAIGAYFLWFHWILMVDTLTPPVRKQLGFRKQFAVPVVVSVWIGICSVCYAILIDSSTLSDRVIFRWRVGKHDLEAGTKTILLNRILTIFAWTLRLMWQVLNAGESELVLIRGSLDYYCPFDTFTGMKVAPKPIVPVGDPRRRRDSDGSILLPTESSYRHLGTLHKLLRRGSAQRGLKVGISPSAPNLSPQPSLKQVEAAPLTSREVQDRLEAALNLLATEMSPRTTAFTTLPRQSLKAVTPSIPATRSFKLPTVQSPTSPTASELFASRCQSIDGCAPHVEDVVRPFRRSIGGKSPT